jgi:hypothetical protein
MNSWSNADIENLMMLLRAINENLIKIRETSAHIESYLRPVLPDEAIVNEWLSISGLNDATPAGAEESEVVG